MFGYIRAYKPDMRFREYETYKAIYCSLCKELGRSYSPLARLSLSYDFTFMAMLYMSLSEGCTGYEKKRCVANPLKKCMYCKSELVELKYTAAAAMVLGEYKISDNIADSGFVKSILYRVVHPLFKSWRKKALRDFPFLEQIVLEYAQSQNTVEKNAVTGIDRAAEPTANALKAIFAACSDDECVKADLAMMGFCLGKWVYLIDVGADLEDDTKKGSYNPIKRETEVEKPLEYARERLTPTLNVCMVECAKAFEQLPIKKYKPILENILYMGLEACQTEIFNKEKNK
ncbi:MAG: DUF5685 family protein [Oscillospiraceae bacterium]